MTYKGHTIIAEAITARATYHLDDDGNPTSYGQDIDTELEITNYAIEDKDGDILEWVDTIEQAKQFIDKE